MTVQDIADRLGLKPEEIGLISINGVQSELEDVMPPDGRLCFFPPISGGSSAGCQLRIDLIFSVMEECYELLASREPQ